MLLGVVVDYLIHMEVYLINMEHNTVGTPPAGSIRFNTDSSKMEIYNGDKWWEIDSTSPNEQTGGTRMIVSGGYVNPSGTVNIIDYFQMETTGDALDFGDLVQSSRHDAFGVSSRTRAVHGGGGVYPDSYNEIQHITIASTGNSVDAGNMFHSTSGGGSVSDGIRGVFMGGYAPSQPALTNVMSYITIATTGDGLDFGDLSSAQRGNWGGATNGTRGVTLGGYPGSMTNNIEYITIQTLGNTADFGDTIGEATFACTASNAVRGIYSLTYDQPAYITPIEYITIATLGNAVDFGERIAAWGNHRNGASSTRVCWCGGTSPRPGEADTATIGYVQIMTTGNEIDFGDLTQTRESICANTNGHGGLS